MVQYRKPAIKSESKAGNPKVSCVLLIGKNENKTAITHEIIAR